MPESGYWYIELASGKNYVVHVKLCDIDMLHCDETAWVADTGVRVGEFIKDGPKPASEIEAMGPGRFPRSLITGLWAWPHAMPVTQ